MDTKFDEKEITPRSLRNTVKEWLFLDIEVKELLFVLLSFCDAKLTTLCLDLGGLEAVPWMKGWGANVALRMAVATAILLYLKMRGISKYIWIGNIVLLIIVIWNFFMLLLLAFTKVEFASSFMIKW
jgi:hypothetical protein